MKSLSILLLTLVAIQGCSLFSPTYVPNYNIGPANGLSADRPVFTTESNGVFKNPWGAAGGSWPEQLFWEDVKLYKDVHNEMLESAQSIENDGKAAIMGNVAWGIDLLLANGGDASLGLLDYSERDGYKQYASWMNPRAQSYFAQFTTGEIGYAGQGYISFGMPMLAEDIPPGEGPQTFGEWAGKRLGKLALDINCRGVYGADYFIGLNFGTDSHPRLIDSFETWSGRSVPGSTNASRSAYITNNFPALWYDFIAEMQATYFISMGKTILAGGKTPLLGGQIASNPPLSRLFGNDPRIWYEKFPGPYWIFYVETQSAGDRNTPPTWTSLYSIGSTASRSPGVAIGIMLDADNNEFWGAAERAGWTREKGWNYLKHTWLAAGWTHMANPDGTVRRAAQSFMRSYWDAGGTNDEHIEAILGHIPKHPFGPAMYYSTNVERSFEAPPIQGVEIPNYYYYSEYLQTGIRTDDGTNSRPGMMGAIQGLNLGYWVSDAVDPASLEASNIPSAWLLYNSDRLPAAERVRLEALAPVLDLHTQTNEALAAGPVRAIGPGLNCLAFVDQNSNVVIMVTNSNSTATSGSLQFTNVNDGSFTVNGLLGTHNSTLKITSNTGSLKTRVAANDTNIYEIPGLRWQGH